MAEPMLVTGDPRASLLATPEPQSGAPCGRVDTLDFPLDPPEGNDVVRGGGDFGRYRRRYEKFHTGEDWWETRGSSFGEPVYSIGHGVVTYAEPLGWGRDQGTLVIRHIFEDGSTFLSFYGHLDPPSVVLTAGECVERGEKVGEIGRPRSSPHLHFEIRTHMPYEPGGGYWAVDPTQAGWLSPSETIWANRLTGSPGVLWVRPPASQDTQTIGLIGDHTFVVLEDSQLVGLNVTDGRRSWTFAGADEIDGALIDAEWPLIYVANQFGEIEAYALPEPGEENGVPTLQTGSEPLWSVDFDAVGLPIMLPLPGGGAILITYDRLFAVSPGGEPLWETDLENRIYDWVTVGDKLILSTLNRDRSFWTADESGVHPWDLPPGLKLGGHLAEASEVLYLYDREGIFSLDPDSQEAVLLYALPPALAGQGAAVGLPDGGLLVAHVDRYDRRLIALEADGTVRWERSIAGETEGDFRLLIHDRVPYLVAQDVQNGASQISIFLVDVEEIELKHIFSGGTRTAAPGETQLFSVGDMVLLQIGGGHLVAFDPEAAAETIAASLAR